MNSTVPVQWPADRVERRAVASLIPYARNARTHTAAQVDQIAASIREWGWTTPVLLDEENGIIAGHGRVMAAKKLGIDEIPVMIASGWTEAQKRAYVVADNKLALNAGWDEDLLKIELGDLKDLDFDLDLTGFDQSEIAEALADSIAVPDPEAEPEAVASAPVSEVGDVWSIGRSQVECGDNPAQVDVVVTGWQKATAQVAKLKATGETFVQVLARRRPSQPVTVEKVKARKKPGRKKAA